MQLIIMNKQQDISYFVSFCIEQYKNSMRLKKTNSGTPAQRNCIMIYTMTYNLHNLLIITPPTTSFHKIVGDKFLFYLLFEYATASFLRRNNIVLHLNQIYY